MSKKTRSKQVNAENRYGRSSIVAAAVGVLVLAVVAATFLYESGDTQSGKVEAVARQAAIAKVGLNMEQLTADMNTVEVTQRIEQDKKDSILLKVSATPEYFVNGRPLPSFGQQQLADLIREELAK